MLREGDTIASICAAHQEVCDGSRRRVAERSLDDTLLDRQSKPLTVRFLFLQRLREYAQHTGHADILREQILAVA
jgi:hypothetical protein